MMKFHHLLLFISYSILSHQMIFGMENPTQAQLTSNIPLSIKQIQNRIYDNLYVLETGRTITSYNPSLTSEQRVQEIVDLLLNNLTLLSKNDLEFMAEVISETFFFLDYLLIKKFISRFDELVVTQLEGVNKFLEIMETGFHLAKARKDVIKNEFTSKFKNSIVSLLLKNIILFTQNSSEKDIDFLIYFLDCNTLIPRVIELIKEIKPSIIASIFKKSQTCYRSKNIDVQFAQAILANSAQFERETISLAQQIVDKAKQMAEKIKYSPTMRHLSIHELSGTSIDREARDLEKKFLNNPDLKDLYLSFLEKEKELNKAGYYTFVHGQRRELYFPEKLYTFLWQQRKKQPVNNFLFAHVKDLVETPEAQLQEDILRKTIRVAGTQMDSDQPETVDPQRRKLVLFMNYAFFANTTVRGSSTSYYIYNDYNSPTGREVRILNQEPFTLLGYDWLYKKYQSEVDALANDYANLSKHGNLLLIAVPKDDIRKYVYLAKSGGFPRSINIKGFGQTTDMKRIMEALTQDPENVEETDKLEFCLIMTQYKGGLDPSTGIQIYPFISGPPEKLIILKKREDELFARMEADIKKLQRARL